MLFGIGVDIVEIDRFRCMVERFGDRVARRLLTAHEFEQFQERKNSVLFLASRFAAKEAASKALGTGIAQGIGFKSIEIRNDERGQPQLNFRAMAQEHVRKNNIQRSMLSLSDEKHYAVAMVVLETG